MKVHEDQFGAEISALVDGTNYAPYEQNIYLYLDSDMDSWDEFSIEGDCSCPMGFNCKHVAAVVFSVEEQLAPGRKAAQKQSPGGSFSNWLAQTTSSLTEPTTVQSSAASNQVLVFELHVSHFNLPQNRLSIKSVKTRKLKSGELSQAQPSQVQLFNIQGGERFLAPGDSEIIYALQVCARDQINRVGFLHDGIRLSGRIGTIALEQMLSTNRFYLGDYREGKMLSPDDPREGTFQWLLDPSGVQNLRFTAGSVIHHVFDVNPLMGLTHQGLKVFPIQTTMESRQIFRLIGAPPVEAGQSLEITDAQRDSLEKSDIPAPAAIHTHDIDIETIHPILKLGIARDSQGEPCDRAYSISLFVQYNDMEPLAVPGTDQVVSRFKDGTLERCTRDFDYEQKIIDLLVTEYAVADLSEFFLGKVPVPGYFGFEHSVDWYEFLEVGVKRLEKNGWLIFVEDDFDLTFDEVDQWHADIEYGENTGWFDLALGIEVAGNKIQLLPILLSSFKGRRFTDSLEMLQKNPQGKQPVEIGKGRHILLPNDRLIPLLETFVELFDQETTLSDGRLQLSTAQELRLLSISDQNWAWRGGKQLENLTEQINQFRGISAIDVPKSFSGTLRDYQQHGVDWLQFMRQFQLGGILADDMGLGKTVQTLAHFCVEKQHGRLDKPSLIVAPTSLMSNWRNETAGFAPTLSLLVLHGAERHQHFAQIDQHDIVLTSYALVVRDAEILSAHDYHYLVLDESQKIKNHKTKAAIVLQQVRSAHRLCLTGTPMENHLGELWSQFHFLMPGFLGDEKYFNQQYRKPIEKLQDHQRGAALQKRIAPVLLRRTKDLVAGELPAKTEILQSVALSGAQRDLYETIRLMMDKKVRKEIASKGVARSHIMILDALLKLRQVCCHPGLLKLNAAKGVKDSAKLEMLLGMLPELVEEGRRILLFSQFTSMLSVIESELKKLKINYVKLTGSTRDRETPIQRFQANEVPIFLISLKAGGTGLNLTSADTVIHYDPWWNPAVEDQATDRSHRIGQDKPVFVYKLVTENTVESKILEMQQRKRLLAEQTLSKSRESTAPLTEEDLRQLFGSAGG